MLQEGWEDRSVRVFCKRSSGSVLTLSHLSELCKVFPYRLLAT